MKQDRFGRLYWAAFVLSFGFLCFIFGYVTTTLDYFPSPLMSLVAEELASLYAGTNRFQSDMYVAVSSSRTGVVRYDPERAFNGYTLYISAHTQGAFLIDMQGNIVHEWHLLYDRIWNRSAAIKYPAISQKVMWRDVYLYPNGDVLAVYEGWGPHLFGYGLAKMDRNSKPMWTYLDHVHHDVSVGQDGRIYTLVHAWRTKPISEFPEIKTPCTEGFVVVLSSDGKLLKKVSLFDAFARSQYRGMMGLLKLFTIEDFLHTNSVKPLPSGFATMFPQAGPNTVLISSRHLDAIALLDLDAEKIVWLMRGPWARQHDARPLPNGDIMLFDDLGDFAHGNHSRVLEFQPNPFKLVWEFPGDSGEVLNSEILGAAEKLPNGNVLITDSGTARLLEVTPDKKVVWEYRSPFLQGDHRQFVAVLNSGHRYAPGDLHFQFNRQDGSNSLNP